VATERVYRALTGLESARQRWQRAEEQYTRERDAALQEQERLKTELAQIERAINEGETARILQQQGVTGQQTTFNVRGSSLKMRRQQILRMLHQFPDQVPAPRGAFF